MATEPSSESIENVAAVTGLLLGEASKWLKVQLLVSRLVCAASEAKDYSCVEAYNCDAQAASNAYFDNDGVLQDHVRPQNPRLKATF